MDIQTIVSELKGEPNPPDPLGAINNLQFTGSDFLADKDVCSIVLRPA